MSFTGKELTAIRLNMGLNQTEFAQLLGYERSAISKMEKQTDPFSRTVEAKIRIKLGQEYSHFFTPDIVNEKMPPYRKARAGRISTSNTQVQIRNLLATAIDNVQDGQYDIFTVDGNSMHPTFFPGDKLLCRMIKLEELIDNQVYVVVTNRPDMLAEREDGIWLKRCAHREKNGYLNCKSDNKDSAEPFVTFRLTPNQIEEIWRPVMRLTANMADPNRDIYDKLDEIESRLEMLESINDINT